MTTLVSFAMFGLMFAMPQYFQEVRGADPLGSGLRGLPLLGGMLVGMIGGTRLQAPAKDSPRPPLLSAKAAVAIGFAIMAGGIGIGALSTLSAERSGSGSALISAVRQVGATIGVAVAQRLRSAGFLDEVRGAFIHGLDVMLWCCAGIAVSGALLAHAFLPRRAGQAGAR